MSTFEIVEYGLVLLIIGLQFWFFGSTRAAIRSYRNALPDGTAFRLHHASLVRDDLNRVPVNELLDQLPQHEAHARAASRQQMLKHMIDRADMTDDEAKQRLTAGSEIWSEEYVRQYFADNNLILTTNTVQLTLLSIYGDADRSPVMIDIQRSINTYLVRNKGAISDFNLLRDIIQRNLDMVEDDIALTTPIPVYLGLVGTMLGIIIGLFALPDISSETFLTGNGINSLLGGVKIAMIASAAGLILTVITNGWLFKGAKMQIERRKNTFFTFLQTELLPILSESVNAGVVSLNRSLDAFGAKFGTDIGNLNILMQRNYESVMAQQSALNALKDMDISRIAQFNVQVLGELRQSLDAIERLGFALNHADAFATNARALVERTQDVLGLTDRIGQVLDNTQALQHYLNGHFQELENRGDLIKNAVTSLDLLISREIGGLETHIHERMRAVQDIKITEDAWMQRAMKENQSALSNLNHLPSLTDTAKANAAQQRVATESLNQLSDQARQTNALLTQLLREQQTRNWGRRVRKFFRIGD